MYVLFDYELAQASSVTVGGKASVLATMRSADLPVPAFFVVVAAALEQHLAGGLDPRSAPISSGSGNVVEIIQSRALADGVLDEVSHALSKLLSSASGSHELVAVRSSAAQEDRAEASFAGQFTSVLGVESQSRSVGEAIKLCWISYFSERAMHYRAATGVDGLTPDFGVIVQRQLFPDKAGVLFTRHPLFPDEIDRCYIEANFGTGESVVGGLATPDSYTCEWPTGALVEQRTNSKRKMSIVKPEGGTEVIDVPPQLRAERVLSDEETGALVGLATKVERLFGVPQDIEWAIVDRSSWIVQSRPITHRATKELYEH